MTKPRKLESKLKRRRASDDEDNGPPHSIEAEQGVLGCIMLSPLDSLDACVKAFESPEVFYDLRHRTIYETFIDRASRRKGLDLISLQASLKDRKLLESIGGLSYLASLPDVTPSAANIDYYIEIVREKHQLRTMIQTCTEIFERCHGFKGDHEQLMDEVSRDLDRVTYGARAGKRGELKIWKVSDLLKHVPPKNQALVGDNEIRMGLEGLVLIAGPGGTGKSLALSSLGLAGAIGKGTWQGRTVHRRFKTMFLQAENGATRLKKEVTEMQRLHPGVNLDECIFISDPPEGGIPFHRAEFRASLRREVAKIEPDVLVIDPWSRVAADDSSKDIVDKLAEIYSCLPAGEKCPCVVISAHTKKPRSEDVMKGRALANMVSGSVALKDSARCVYMILPWSEEPADDRVYWCNAKLNDGAMYPPSVWRRRFGTFFDHDGETDPGDWGKEPDEDNERRAVTREMLVTVFKEQKRPGMKRGELVRCLVERFDLAESTCWRALKGYGAEWVDCVAGVVALKRGEK